MRRGILSLLMIVFYLAMSVGASGINVWETNWQWRMPVQITENSGNALSNYQVLITVDTASLISVGKMRADCGDIRFIDTTDSELAYWLEKGCNTADTKIWVKVPSIPASSTETIYMYYGNLSVSSMSNGSRVFLFYEDFESYSLGELNSQGGWHNPQGGVNASTLFMVQSAMAYEGSKGVVGEGHTPFTSATIDHDVPQAKNGEITYYLNSDSVSRLQGIAILEDSTEITSFTTDDFRFRDNVGYVGNSAANTWYKMTVRIYDTNIHDLLVDDGATLQLKGRVNTNNMTDGFNKIQLITSHIGEKAYFDKIIYRKYNDPEPTTSLGAEQLIIPASIDIDPDTLNLKAKGVFTAYITLPEDYSIEDIDGTTIECEGAQAIRTSIEDSVLVVKFNRKDLVGVEAGEEVTLTVTGELTDGTFFAGSDTVKVT